MASFQSYNSRFDMAQAGPGIHCYGLKPSTGFVIGEVREVNHRTAKPGKSCLKKRVIPRFGNNMSIISNAAGKTPSEERAKVTRFDPDDAEDMETGELYASNPRSRAQWDKATLRERAVRATLMHHAGNPDWYKPSQEHAKPKEEEAFDDLANLMARCTLEESQPSYERWIEEQHVTAFANARRSRGREHLTFKYARKAQIEQPNRELAAFRAEQEAEKEAERNKREKVKNHAKVISEQTKRAQAAQAQVAQAVQAAQWRHWAAGHGHGHQQSTPQVRQCATTTGNPLAQPLAMSTNPLFIGGRAIGLPPAW